MLYVSSDLSECHPSVANVELTLTNQEQGQPVPPPRPLPEQFQQLLMKQKLEVGLQAIDREGLSVLGWQTAGGHLPKHVLLNINNIFPFFVTFRSVDWITSDNFWWVSCTRLWKFTFCLFGRNNTQKLVKSKNKKIRRTLCLSNAISYCHNYFKFLSQQFLWRQFSTNYFIALSIIPVIKKSQLQTEY